MSRWRGYIGAAGLLVAASIPGLLVRTRIEPANLVMPYLLAVVFAALYLGRGPAIFAAVGGVLAFDFAMVPPFHTFAVDDVEYLITFFALLVVGLVISHLAARAKERADAALEKASLLEKLQAVQLEQAREELQTALLQAMSHDLRTPLVSITGTLGVLADNSLALDPSDRAELIDNALEEAERLNRLVGDLLDVSRLEAGSLPLRFEACDVQDLIGAALAQMGARLDDRPSNVTLPASGGEDKFEGPAQEAARPGGLPPVRADFAAITQVLVNILDNAARYSSPGTPIDIQARQKDSCVYVDISDRGPGIPAEHTDRVFERGFRVPGSSAISSGTGLGLTISRGLVQAHGGTVVLEPRPDGGLTVRIGLPVAEEESD